MNPLIALDDAIAAGSLQAAAELEWPDRRVPKGPTMARKVHALLPKIGAADHDLPIAQHAGVLGLRCGMPTARRTHFAAKTPARDSCHRRRPSQRTEQMQAACGLAAAAPRDRRTAAARRCLSGLSDSGALLLGGGVGGCARGAAERAGGGGRFADGGSDRISGGGRADADWRAKPWAGRPAAAPRLPLPDGCVRCEHAAVRSTHWAGWRRRRRRR